ncbi:MAG: glycosyltransferase family 2 protein [Deltaproteobacteria bacterium]|nr:glycosyltransferase family 2 protein [Deltaproteobacteria bacterium]
MTDNVIYPLLTIAIPTWNREVFLAQNLEQLSQEGRNIWDMIEVLVSDNASSDDTPQVVADAIAGGMPIRYIRNAENIGSDANIAQCFNLAQGKFVLILGDDDLLIDGALSFLLERLAIGTYGVVCLRPYGFESDFRKEYPISGGRERIFCDAGAFLATIGPLMTLISSCVINKVLLPKIDARKFCGDNLVQVHLVLRAALAAKENLFVDRYLIAYKRNNSSEYDFSQVFVSNLGAVLDSCKSFGLTESAILTIEKRLIFAYYPFCILRQRLSKTGDLNATFARFEERFHGCFLYKYWLVPIIRLPRPLGIFWGGMTTVIGRALSGDLRLGIAFAWNRILSVWRDV